MSSNPKFFCSTGHMHVKLINYTSVQSIMINTINDSDASSDLAQAVAIITGDGHLQIQGWRHLVSFYSKDFTEILRVKEMFNNLFGISGRIYEDNSFTLLTQRKHKRYKLFFISKQLALFFKEIGVPVGNKTNVAFQVPDWILRGNDAVKSAYLRGLFDCEGYVCRSSLKSGKIRWQISIHMCKNQKLLSDGLLFMNQLRELLLHFEIWSSPVRTYEENLRKDGSHSFDMRFDIEKSSFRKFYKHIGFRIKEKQARLLSALE